jgi:hypothetical protein
MRPVASTTSRRASRGRCAGTVAAFMLSTRRCGRCARDRSAR